MAPIAAALARLSRALGAPLRRRRGYRARHHIRPQAGAEESDPPWKAPADGLCQCFCRVTHPDTARYDACVDAHSPGKFIDRTAPDGGTVWIPLCDFCFAL